MNYNDYVERVFISENGARQWSRFGLYDPATNEGVGKYNNKLYRMKYVLEQIPPAKSPDELGVDLGCGAGPYLPGLKQKGYKVLGMDIAPQMIEAAREMCSFSNTQADLAVGDCGDTKLAAGSVSVCLCVGLIEHLPGDDRLLAEVHRILRPGGTMIITIRNYLSPHFRWKMFYGEAMRLVVNGARTLRGLSPLARGEDGHTYSFLSREHAVPAFKSRLARHGFEIDSIRYSHFYALPAPFERRFPVFEAKWGKRMESWNSGVLGCLASTAIVTARRP
jgi:SAM-dependent methyltransferase